MNRQYSLRKNFEIEKLVKKRMSVGNKYFAIYYQKNQLGLQIAISVSKKNGNAVERNYQKRVIREIMRNNLEKLSGYRLLVVVKKDSRELSFEEKKENILYLLKKIERNNK